MGAPLPHALWIDGQAGTQLITLANEGQVALTLPPNQGGGSQCRGRREVKFNEVFGEA